jgi:hypothetical protein
MLRSFRLGDLALVHRLGERGILFHTEAALTCSSHPLRSALRNMLAVNRHSTYVWKSEDRAAAGFAQVLWEEASPSARLTCMGLEGGESDAERSEDLWHALVDQLVPEIGKRGFHSLIAETSETGPELPILRRAGFAVYTRQDIWLSDSLPSIGIADPLRPRQTADDWDIQVLYANLVPRLIQSVEPNPPLQGGQNLVLREEGELAAYVHISSGPLASLMRLFIHPNARTGAQEIVRMAHLAAVSSPPKPVYCCVSRFQSWLQSSLADCGFSLWGSQALMVKHVVQLVRDQAPVPQYVLEKQAVTSSSPFLHNCWTRESVKYRNN